MSTVADMQSEELTGRLDDIISLLNEKNVERVASELMDNKWWSKLNELVAIYGAACICTGETVNSARTREAHKLLMEHIRSLTLNED